MSAVCDPDTWQRLAALLDEGLELPAAERPAFAARVCGEDEVLRHELAALLAADERAGEFLSWTVDRYLPGLADDALGENAEVPVLPAGDRVGPYRLLEELGEGGMGTVYLAERVDGQFDRRVALKLIRRGLESGEVRRRFLRERQILAALEHPHIAGLLDGGVTESGLPWFAMELVSGEPITGYCDARALDVEARLRLFAAVCAAVQHAHRNLVVHRDLKPSNILVTSAGEVKLLDFGIAKLVGDDEADGRTVTRAILRPLTPQYAAPEVLRGEAITTSADVYSLGVLLHELLTGRRHRRPPVAGGAEVELEPPSVVVTRPLEPARPGREDATPAEIARRRGASIAHLRRRLRGDLDVIALKALQEAPGRRYASVEAMADDIRRHLAKEAIAARPDSLAYRSGRFLRRHRLGAAAASLVALSLVVGLAAALWQGRRAAREAARATAVQGFLEGLFEASDPNERRGATVTARELLDRGAGRIQSELVDPRLQADLLETVGTLYRKLGLFDQGQLHLERSLALRRQLFGEQGVETAKSLAGLGRLHAEKEDFAAAEPLLRRALAIRRGRSSDDPEIAELLSDLGACSRLRGDYAAAEPLYLEALERQRRRWGDSHPEVASALNSLAVLRFEQGRYQEAEELYRQALQRHLAAYGEDHTEVATDLFNLGLVLKTRGRHAEAERTYRRVLQIRRKLLGDRHVLVGRTLQELASLLEKRHELDEAEALQGEALAIYRDAMGGDSSLLANGLNSVAVQRYLRGDYEGAAEAMREALGIWRRASGGDHPLVLQVMVNLGAILRDLGRYDEAEPLLREAATKLVAKLGEGNAEAARARSTLGSVLRLRGDAASAEAIHRQTLTVRRKALGERHEAVAEALYQLGLDLRASGRLAEAESDLVSAVDISREAAGGDNVRRTDFLLALAALRLDQGHFAAAEELAREAMTVRRKKLGERDWRTGEALVVWGRGLERLGRCRDGADAVGAGSELLREGKTPDPVRARIASLRGACGDG